MKTTELFRTLLVSAGAMLAAGISAAAEGDSDTDPPMPNVPAEVIAAHGECGYAVVISDLSASKPEWKAVADALVKKHGGRLVVYKGSVVNCLPELAKLHPLYTAFVARPEIVGRKLVARIHRLTRRLDGGPYTGTVWGIVSGATPEAALRVATATGPEVVHSVISNTGVHNPAFATVFTLSDGKPGNWYYKDSAGKEHHGSDGDADRTELFVDKFKEVKPDAIVTSGHATEMNLEMPFGKGNTEVHDGKWCGIVNWRRPGAEESVVVIPQDDHPRVFLGAGNCLIGNFHKSPKSMAATLISNYGVNQFVGYTVPTWYGKGGWGTLGLWQHLAGRYSLAEAWFFNNQIITHELKSRFPKVADRCLPISEDGMGLDERRIFSDDITDKDEAGMLWDRDVVAFYGDPALRVTLDPGKLPGGVETKLSHDGNLYALEVHIGDKPEGASKDQPLAVLFPHRVAGKIALVSGKEFAPVVTSRFIMLTKPKYEPGSRYKVGFRAGEELSRVSGVRLETNKDAWTFLASGGTLAEYCPKASPFKPYMKRLFTPGGVQVLRDSPYDHKHHHAMMFAVGVDGANFWEEAAEAGKEAPREGHSERSGFLIGAAWTAFSQDIDWIDGAPPGSGKKLLVEKRSVGVVAPHGPKPATVVTWAEELSPARGLAAVKLDGHYYYGLGMRFVTSMDSGGRFFNATSRPGEVVHNTERLAAAKWCAYTAKADGKPVTVAIFDHPSNPRHPNKMFTMSIPFAYLSATLNLWKEPLVLKLGETLKLKYAVALWDGEATAEQVESLYADWAAVK